MTVARKYGIVMLSDLFRETTRRDTVERHLFDPGAVEAFLDDGRDVPLYAAIRDCQSPIEPNDGGVSRWRCDSVYYTGIELPGGEYNRSIGHWNSTDQIEIFRVERGEVVIIVCSRDGADIVAKRCIAGSVVGLSAGEWHITYALEASWVVNIYSEGAASQEGRDKYARAPALPVVLGHVGSRKAVTRPSTVDVRWETSPMGGERGVDDIFGEGRLAIEDLVTACLGPEGLARCRSDG